MDPEMKSKCETTVSHESSDASKETSQIILKGSEDAEVEEVNRSDHSTAQSIYLSDIPDELLLLIFQHAIYYYYTPGNQLKQYVTAICIALTSNKFYGLIKTLEPEPLEGKECRENLLNWMGPKYRNFPYFEIVGYMDFEDYGIYGLPHPIAVNVEVYGEQESIMERKLAERIRDSFTFNCHSLLKPPLVFGRGEDWCADMLAIYEARPTPKRPGGCAPRSWERSWRGMYVWTWIQDRYMGQWLEDWGKLVQW